MKFLLFFLIAFQLSANINLPKEDILKKQIGRMLIVGFENEYVDKNSKIISDINTYSLGGVILFDRFYNNKNKTKNISSPKQLKELTSSLKKYAKKPLLIAIDQEGGKVARLKPSYGFLKIPSAKDISKMDLNKAKKIYTNQAEMLKDSGINCDFAPVVDLALNKQNKVIYQLKRSYGSDAKKVAKYAETFLDTLQTNHIVGVLKHFPGHGSSLSDSHKGFVDITNSWSKKELEPYKILIKKDKVKMIMTAHVFNAKLDKNYPSTLSYNVNTKLLREKLGFKGIIVSDDMQMGAIKKHFRLKQSVTLAINSGVDMLLFGNQLSNNSVEQIIDTIYKQLLDGAIPYGRILESNKRIDNVLNF